jgi:predicted GIY-YIG superfamily endonuclease
MGHVWDAVVSNRTGNGTGCPECSNHGFKPNQPGWIYLLARAGEQQMGITNKSDRRLSEHAKYGWQKLEVMGPFSGKQALSLEQHLKQWLRKEIGLVPGTHENWFTARMEVRSLSELKARSGVETELF